MTTPFIMLFLVTFPYIGARSVSAITGRELDARFAAIIGLSALFTFTASGHFIHEEAMVQMLPNWIPERNSIVYFTGVLELAIAIGFMLPKLVRFTGFVAAATLILFFPVNIFAAINHAPMGGARMGSLVSFYSSPTAGHHLILGVLAYNKAMNRCNIHLESEIGVPSASLSDQL